VETADLNDDANSPLHVRNDTPAVSATNEACVNATLLPTTLLQRATSDDDLAAARPAVEHDEAVASIYTQTLPITANSRSQKHLHEIGLPKHYAPNHLVPEGKMRVVGVKAKKSHRRKLS